MNSKSHDLSQRAHRIISQSNPVGLISKAFGSEGELVVKIRESFPEDHTEPLWVDIDSMAVPLFISSFATQGLSKAVIVFDDFSSKERAAMLIGKELFAMQEAAPEEESEWGFLAGYSFEDTVSSRKGTVTEYIDDDFNPLLEVEIDGGSFLVPFSERLTDRIDKRRRTIRMSLPEGIFEL